MSGARWRLLKLGCLLHLSVVFSAEVLNSNYYKPQYLEYLANKAFNSLSKVKVAEFGTQTEDFKDFSIRNLTSEEVMEEVFVFLKKSYGPHNEENAFKKVVYFYEENKKVVYFYEENKSDNRLAPWSESCHSQK